MKSEPANVAVEKKHTKETAKPLQVELNNGCSVAFSLSRPDCFNNSARRQFFAAPLNVAFHTLRTAPSRTSLECGLIAERVHVGLGSDPCGKIRSRLKLSLNGDLDEDELRRFERRNAYDEDSMSFWVMVVSSQQTKKASCSVEPLNAPCFQRLARRFWIDERRVTHSAGPLGSDTPH